MPVPRRNVVGLPFGYLTVLKAMSGDRLRVRCKCGKIKTILQSSLRRTKSCGCMKGKLISIGKTQHGQKKAGERTPEYVCWVNIKERCYNKRRQDYPDYGGRGIRVCPEWRKSFTQFFKDMGRKPDPSYSIERREVDGPYSAENCYWADAHTQRMNQRRMKLAA
jgi:hypothetical protein